MSVHFAWTRLHDAPSLYLHAYDRPICHSESLVLYSIFLTVVLSEPHALAFKRKSPSVAFCPLSYVFSPYGTSGVTLRSLFRLDFRIPYLLPPRLLPHHEAAAVNRTVWFAARGCTFDSRFTNTLIH